MCVRFLILALAGGLAAAEAAAEATIRLQPVWEKAELPRPVALVIPPDGSQRLFLVQQRGQIQILPQDRASAQPSLFLDISGRDLEENEFEEGLLGLAFHPKFAENRRFFIYYTKQNPKRSVLSEMKVSAEDPQRADVKSERVLLEIPQPFWNHNSGNLLFGPDGMLYIAVGDGGKRDDVARLAQNLFILNGSILRIDVDRKDGDREYGIPQDNPFVRTEGARPEIWAYGLRNPWGIWIDEPTGLFWCADVGQDLWEEIDLIEKGGNYGWSYREGLHEFPPRKDQPPADLRLIDPVHEYPRSDGISITGGFVYRGKRLPDLQGWYVYGDWGSGRIWALSYDPATRRVTENRLLLAPQGVVDATKVVKPTAFAPDENGEILILNWNGGLVEVHPAR